MLPRTRVLSLVISHSILDSSEPKTLPSDIVWANDDEKEGDKTFDKTEFLSLDLMNARHIERALRLTKGKIHGKGGAAELLDINPSTLRHRMRRLGVPQGMGK